MKIYCPHCGVKGSANDSYLGKNVKCPKCHEIFVASGVVAVERKEELTDESALSVPTSEEALAEIPTDLREEEDILEELGVSVKEETLPEEIEAELTAVGGEESVALHPADTAPVVEEEEMLDWSDIVAEIESQPANDEIRDNEDYEEAPADLDRLFDYAETPGEELDLSVEAIPAATEPETVIAETVAGGFAENDRIPTIDEELGTIPPITDREEGLLAEPAESVTADDGHESHFIFEDRAAEAEPVQEIESQPYGLVEEQCWQCGRKDRIGVPFITKDGRLYCPDCVPVDELEAARQDRASTEQAGVPLPEGGTKPESGPAGELQHRFTIGGALREAWGKTKGAKGAIWAGSAVMYLTILILVAGGTFLLPVNGNESLDINMTGWVGSLAFQTVTDSLSVLFTAGLIFMAIRKVAGDTVSWKMVFSGFSVAGRIIVATVLQAILIFIGLLLLVLPGIYLAIGYAMTVPLIIDRKMSPWQAMEASRQAIHKVWWKVTGLFLVMGLIFLVSKVPLGIGLIWTWPMFFILIGVVYRYLFGVEKKVG